MDKKEYKWYEVALDFIWDGIDIVLPAVAKLIGHLIKALAETF